jgi:hypothetical protein
MNNTSVVRLRPTSWKWLVVTYCFLILFHCFPSSLMSGMNLIFTFFPPFSITLWLGIGIVSVSAYVGFRSLGATIVEPGIASVFYVASLFFLLPDVWPRAFYYRVITTPWLAAFLILVFLAGCLGAALGGWLQLRREKRQALALKE